MIVMVLILVLDFGVMIKLIGIYLERLIFWTWCACYHYIFLFGNRESFAYMFSNKIGKKTIPCI